MAAENPPTEKKLAWLRENGIVPYSRVATFCSLILLLIICLAASYGYIENIINLIKNDNLNELAEQFWPILLPAVVTLFGLFLVIMLQTKFLIKPNLVIPQAARLSPFKGHFSFSKIFARIFCGLIELLLFSIISALLAYGTFVASIKVFNLPPLKALYAFQGFSMEALPVIILVCLMCISLGILLSRLIFRRRHSMTREELELEERG